jgi:hypothetical protein
MVLKLNNKPVDTYPVVPWFRGTTEKCYISINVTW